MKINTSRKAGFTLVEIMIVVAIIGLLAAIAIPNFVKARNTSQLNACINNLRQMDSATQQWALETKKQDTDLTAGAEASIYAYLKSQAVPICPAGGVYSLGTTVVDSPDCDVAGHDLP
jgi:prepilin-type N-terminal cleavage/methylation domain-containing protein